MTQRNVDVCIVGGGLMGCFTAQFLGQAGRSVLVVEKGTVGREASGVNFGNLRIQGRKPEEFPLSLIAHDIWERFESLTGKSCKYQGCGHTYLAFSTDQHAKLDQYAREAGAAGVDVSVLDSAAVRRRWPALSVMVTAATWSPRDGVAEPALTTPAVARAAQRVNVEIRERCRVTSIEPANNGLLVRTEAGDAINCTRVVNAAGAWSGALSAACGEPVPMFSAGPPIIETEPTAALGLPSLLAVDGSIIARQTSDGAVVLSSFPRLPSDLTTGAPPIKAERIARDLIRLADVIPAVRGLAARTSWSGVEGYVMDMLPVIGSSLKMPGLVHAFGFSGHGFQLAPGVGRVVADLILHGRATVPIDAFTVGRFANGVIADERLSREFEPALVAKVTSETGARP